MSDVKESETANVEAPPYPNDGDRALGQLVLALLLVGLGVVLAGLYVAVKFVKWAWMN